MLPANLYVAPNATPTGDGSIGNSRQLQIALHQPTAVRPEDMIWLRGECYRSTSQHGFISNLNGAAWQPTIVRSYNGARATINRLTSPYSLLIQGSCARYWGLEIINSDPTRISTNKDNPHAYDVLLYAGQGNNRIYLAMMNDTRWANLDLLIPEPTRRTDRTDQTLATGGP